MLAWILGITFVACALYVGAYLLFVKPATYCRKEIWPVYIWREFPLMAQEFWIKLFAVPHWFDVRIRTRLWRPARPEEFRGRVYYHPEFTTRNEKGVGQAFQPDGAAVSDET